LGILTSQVYEEKEVQVDDEATGKSLHSMKKDQINCSEQVGGINCHGQ